MSADAVITLVIPLGAQRDRLLANVGLQSWAYTGVPTRDSVGYRAPGSKVTRRIEVYLFSWSGIPERIQEHLVRTRAQSAGTTVQEARAYLQTHALAIPCADVALR